VQLRRRVTVGQVVGVVGLVLAALLLVAWVYPSSSYLYLADTAKPLADRVRVPGEKPQSGPGGIYYVDVTIRSAKLLERLVPWTRPEGSSLVPESQVVPHGSSFEEQRDAGIVEMARSEKVASAVALEAAGYDVVIDPRGILITGVALDAPSRDDLKEGDVVVSARGRPVRTPAQLRAQMEKVRGGASVVLGIRRDGKVRDVTVQTLATGDTPPRAVIGIAIAQDAKIELPVKVDIDLGRVGGPSAGLPFALDVLDELGTDVDRGHRIAATGEMEIDGSVRPVGGIKQKTYGARRAGAEIFLVPAGDNAEEARRYAGTLRVVPVENFQQALRALRTLPKK
jgi:PDZ domain-containing protein